MLFVSHDRHFLAALSNRVLELTPEGVHQYGGGYTEYVARTGHEAPGCGAEAAELRLAGFGGGADAGVSHIRLRKDHRGVARP